MAVGEERLVSLNNEAWDTHVSFTVLALAPSPCQRFLLAATDRDRHVVFEAGTRRHRTSFYRIHPPILPTAVPLFSPLRYSCC